MGVRRWEETYGGLAVVVVRHADVDPRLRLDAVHDQARERVFVRDTREERVLVSDEGGGCTHNGRALGSRGSQGRRLNRAWRVVGVGSVAPFGSGGHDQYICKAGTYPLMQMEGPLADHTAPGSTES